MSSLNENPSEALPFKNIVDYDMQLLFENSKTRIQKLMTDHRVTNFLKENKLTSILNANEYTSCNYFDTAICSLFSFSVTICIYKGLYGHTIISYFTFKIKNVSFGSELCEVHQNCHSHLWWFVLIHDSPAHKLDVSPGYSSGYKCYSNVNMVFSTLRM